MKNKLTTQEQKFVEETIKTGNVTKAVKLAYGEDDDNYAGVKGYRLIRKDKIKEAINPVIVSMEKERDRLIKFLATKDLEKEKYRDMIDGLDKLTKNIQLLNGGATERQGLSIIFDESFNDTP